MKTVRILSLDGGGIRGIFSATFLKRFCEDAKMSGNELWKYFDIICGTSIGGIQTIAYANGISPDEVITLLKTQATNIFPTSLRPGYALVVGAYGGPANSIALGASLFGLALDGDPYLYNQKPLRDAIESVISPATKMFQLKTNVLVTSVGFTGGSTPGQDNVNFPTGKLTSSTYNQFSNILVPSFTSGQNYSCVDVAVATGSAPIYLRPTTIEGAPANTFFIDGGLYQNNPTALGYAFSNPLFLQKTKTSILSVGTGFSLPDFEAEGSLQGVKGVRDGTSLLGNSLDLTLNGATDAVEQQFRLMSLYKGAAHNLSYYRFQRFLSDDTLSKLDNSTPEAIAYLENEANAQYDQDALQIQLFIEKSGLGTNHSII